VLSSNHFGFLPAPRYFSAFFLYFYHPSLFLQNACIHPLFPLALLHNHFPYMSCHWSHFPHFPYISTFPSYGQLYSIFPFLYYYSQANHPIGLFLSLSILFYLFLSLILSSSIKIPSVSILSSFPFYLFLSPSIFALIWQYDSVLHCIICHFIGNLFVVYLYSICILLATKMYKKVASWGLIDISFLPPTTTFHIWYCQIRVDYQVNISNQ
jgi:hypothetical protein